MSDRLFSREQALAGFPARRARTLLFLIENRTAHLAARAAQVTEPFPSEAVARERDLAFLEAFALGRQPPLRPSITSLFVHGLVIWTNPLERAGALLAALLTLGATVVMVRQEVFASRLIVELREGQDKPSSLSFVAGGQGAPAQVSIELEFPDASGRLEPGGRTRKEAP